MNESFTSTIGILGGVGPAATAYAFERLIRICQRDHGAVQDADFPNVVVTSLPVQGVDEQGYDDTDDTRESLQQQLELSGQTMKKAGADIVYMACNTLHAHEGALSAAGLDEVSPVKITAQWLQDHHAGSSVAILSSRAERREKLYASLLVRQGMAVRPVTDRTQTIIDRLILGAMGGQDLRRHQEMLNRLCDTLLQKVDYVILGCTELSLLVAQDRVEVSGVIDAQEIALQELLRRAR